MNLPTAPDLRSAYPITDGGQSHIATQFECAVVSYFNSPKRRPITMTIHGVESAINNVCCATSVAIAMTEDALDGKNELAHYALYQLRDEVEFLRDLFRASQRPATTLQAVA
jgi:hypothetical protein